MNIDKIGVLGAGVMGSGLTQALALTGHTVVLVDSSSGVLNQVKDNFIKNIRLQMMFNKDLGQIDPHDIVKKVTFTVDQGSLAGVQYVIENVTEKWSVKEEVFLQIDKICPRECIFASNTSAIPIKRLASLTQRPDKFIGLHFMNPVPMKTTVEMIRSPLTSDATIEASKKLLTQMKKQWILVNDSPGFVSNRVLMLTINEAICLVEEKVASVEDIDQVFTSCFGYKMGPLATGDLIGLDTVLLSLGVLYDHLQDDKFKPCPLLKAMVDKGDLGRKTGRGFYDYST